MPLEYSKLRDDMLRQQIAARGVSDPRVLAAMGAIAREDFVPPEQQPFAYEDRPLPIGFDQTISQPYMVALMAEALKISSQDRVLEVGSGSGYAAAVLSRLATKVLSIERHGPLTELAAATLAALGFDNVELRHGNGAEGWPEHAPFDAISVAAGGKRIPPALKEQLAVGGRLVIPIGPPAHQRLLRLTKLASGEFNTEDLGWVAFVPLIDSTARPDGQ